MGRHRKQRTYRTVTVITSVALTLAVGGGYLAADLTDVAPGLLTARHAAARAVPATLTARAGAPAVADAKLDVPVDAAKASQLLDAFAAAPGVGADFSAAIADGTGHIVAERNADTVREPASVTKTLTAFAAAHTLDMGSTIQTEAYVTHADDGATTVTLKGHGDMLLGAGENDLDHTNGRAGLGTLAAGTARALKAQGVSAVTVRYDDTLFGEDRSPAAIVENNGDNRYYTGIATMAVDGGRQWTDLPKPADPDDSGAYPRLSTTPAQDAANTFAARLREQGIAVDGAAQAGQAPDGATPVAQVSSAQLGEVMAFMLRHSDNTLAELFGRLTALRLGTGNSSAGDAEAVAQVLAAHGIPTDGLHLTSCSGLAPGTTLGVRTLIGVQARLLGEKGGAAALEGMSVPGLVGTAKSRGADASVNGLLRVKTGSLVGVRSMAGNVSRKDGGVLCFAVIVNHAGNEWEASKAIDDLMAGLAAL
ncbi:D-alanyl-D-alanine carboxypeptidase [Bifidobacterium pullorum subsp. saeculare]|uniref:D-alanyl-D-alanine carboxypeptidase n=1 Tax=Bifidobacterium pullorum subsp. saeculare TaxID=78257 RepID=A0A938WYD7_9BIFI|nr:D-alanyl-D-alanine carboxypeptidase [Bifidobacterium pullorum]MBM6699952.1 D-alanyl-D-alanine carboxypeptidase [Bifidobacterium pullorum subsp. saeculare]